MCGVEDRRVGKSKTQPWTKNICAAMVVVMPAEWRSCLTESAHLVLGRPLGLFQPLTFGLKL